MYHPTGTNGETSSNTGITLTDLPQSVLLNILDQFGDPGPPDINRLSRVNKCLHHLFSPMLSQRELRLAARRSDINQLNQYLNAGRANANWPLWFDTGCGIFEKPPMGAALQEAANRGNIEALEALLDAGADVNSLDCCGDTALHRAVSGGHFDAVFLLIARGARMDIPDIHDFTPFDVAIEKLRVKAAACFLLMGYDVNKPVGSFGGSALHTAVDGNCALLVATLLVFGADINATDWCGATPLIRAIRKKKLRAVEVLLKDQPNLQIRDRSQRNALWYAIASKDGELEGLFSLYYAGQELDRLIQEAKDEVERWDRRSCVQGA